MAAYRTKTFEEHRTVRRTPEGGWVVMAQSAPVDEAVNGWLADTGHVPVACSPPGIHSYWLDPTMETREVLVMVLLTYQEAPRGQPPESRRVAPAPPAPPPPAPADYPGDV